MHPLPSFVILALLLLFPFLLGVVQLYVFEQLILGVHLVISWHVVVHYSQIDSFFLAADLVGQSRGHLRRCYGGRNVIQEAGGLGLFSL